MRTAHHGGNVWRLARQLRCRPEEILDFSASINPYGPPFWLNTLLAEASETLRHYPDPDCHDLLQAAAGHYRVQLDELVADNGTAEIMHRLVPLLGLTRAVVPVPSYGDYEQVCVLNNITVQRMALCPKNGFALDWDQLHASLAQPALVFLGQPNNPTGQIFTAETLRRTALAHPQSCFIVDEAFADFAPDLERLTENRPPNVAVLLSLTKFYALPGLRIGMAAMDAQLARRYKKHCPAWSVNTLAQAAGTRCMDDEVFRCLTRERITTEAQRLRQRMEHLPRLRVFPSHANFLLCQTLSSDLNAPILAQKLLQKRIAIRACHNFIGLDQRYFRVAVRLPEENDLLCEALEGILCPAKTIHRAKRATPALMLQGTCSNAGKSLLVAALCRILRQDGFSPAPFKAQNMALNSAVTPDGGEIGRAQALQAQACGLEPDRRMNPILLKPDSETGSQVVVLGRPRGNMDVGAYIRAKEELRSLVLEAYDALASEHGVMVLEGAGSPAEINLKSHDLVNMAMARHARAAVLLVGDIDRGGVFAALTGTLDLLDAWERELVRGLVINKFRGRRSLLDPALEWITQRAGKPVLGVVPHIPDLDLPEEDSVAFKQGGLYHRKNGPAELDVVCLDFPHISNFTDLDPLAREPDVALRLVRQVQDLGRPDLLILPGTKNVFADLLFLRERGLDAAICDLARSQATHIVGICGGLQLLGRTVSDPHELESSSAEEVQGLAILPIRTTLERNKTLCRTKAAHLPSGLTLSGYEIHHGRTDLEGPGLEVVFRTEDDRFIGCSLPGGNVWGTYLHGVFDDDAFRRHVLNTVRERKGLAPLASCVVRDVEAGLDRLADIVRAHLDLDRIYDFLGVR
ncbi:MAG TPA: cobyric acid synthase [Desulfonatronum sp.]|nr:cobyric acid synthase [Desulfonatronum sp.]